VREIKYIAVMAMRYLTTKRPGLFTALTFLAIIAAGLWPFRFHPANGLEWLTGENGIYFYGRGMAIGEDDVLPKGPASIEMRVMPRRRNERDIARILSIDNGGIEGFFVGQWKDRLIIGGSSIGPGGRELYKESTVGNPLPADSVRFITVTLDADGASVYLDGRPAAHYPQFTPEKAEGWKAARVILGNSPTGKQYWVGEMLGLAVYDKSMTHDEVSASYRSWEQRGRPQTSGEGAPAALYLFDEHAGAVAHNRLGHGRRLFLPERLEPPEKVVLVPPWRDFRLNRSYISDVAKNLAGFVPLGFFMMAFMMNAVSMSRWRAFAATVLAGLVLSVSIELVQVFMPNRNSQLSDVICNTAGAAIGAFLAPRKRDG
jgi:hypothetical protein